MPLEASYPRGSSLEHFWEDISRWLDPRIRGHQTTRSQVLAPELEVTEAQLRKPSQEVQDVTLLDLPGCGGRHRGCGEAFCWSGGEHLGLACYPHLSCVLGEGHAHCRGP